MIGKKYHPMGGGGYGGSKYTYAPSEEIDEHYLDESYCIIQDNKYEVKADYTFKPMVIFF